MSLVDVKIPEVGESVNEVTLSKWLVKEGDYVEMDQPLCELESDKATLELPAEQSGVIHLIANEGDDLKIGDVIARIDTDASPPQNKEGESAGDNQKEKESAKKDVEADEAQNVQPEVEEPAGAENGSGQHKEVRHPSPAAARLIREHGLSVEEVEGTGKAGRITKADVLKAISEKTSDPDRIAEGKPATPSTPGKFSRQTRREKMSRLRQTISRHLVAAKNQTAMLTTFNEINMEPVMTLRKKYKEVFKEKYGIGLGFMSFFTRACCIALQEFPPVNAMIDGDYIVYHDYCDISIAVSTPRGLVVPVIRNAESLAMHEIEQKVAELAKKGRENKLTLEEMEGGTFTISNGGVFGSLMSTPIINAPQSAILGMHKIEERPVVENGKIVIRPMMYVALSYDHRIIDGKESVSFLVRVKELLEHPEQLLDGNDPVKKLLGL